MKKRVNYRHTVGASSIGYIIQSMVNTFAPLLFVTFQTEYRISLAQVSALIAVNFAAQIVLDFAASGLADRIGYRKCVIAAHLMAAVGIVILVRRESIMHLIFAVLGLMVLMDALVRIQMSIDARRFGLSLWWRILLAAILVGIFGMILLIDPYGGAKMTMVLTGISFLLEGALNLGVAIYTVKVIEGKWDRYDQ